MIKLKPLLQLELKLDEVKKNLGNHGGRMVFKSWDLSNLPWCHTAKSHDIHVLQDGMM